MVFQPGVFPSPPAQILLHDAMHHRLVGPIEVEGHCQCDVTLLVERTGMIAEVHVVAVYGDSFSIVAEQLRRFEDFGDEHRSLPGGRWRQKVKILPDCATNRAGDADIVFEARPAAFDCQRYEFRHYSSALDPEPAIVEEFEVTRCVANDESPKSLVSDENVGAESQHEIFDTEIPGSGYRPCQIVCRCSIVKEISWTTDLECGVLCKRLIALEPLGV